MRRVEDVEPKLTAACGSSHEAAGGECRPLDRRCSHPRPAQQQQQQKQQQPGMQMHRRVGRQVAVQRAARRPLE